MDDYIPYVQAGADECFAGYVPYWWSEKYGTRLALNRREVLCCNVQLGAEEELRILRSMIRVYKKKVHLTFNSLYYLPEQYPEIKEIIWHCMELGFKSYILADPGLILYLRKAKIPCEIHLSGEMGELNHIAVEEMEHFQLKRLIFHRKSTFQDMKAITSTHNMEFEAFVLNELCQFTGAYCNSLHCDEMGYLCRVPYRLGGLKKKTDDRKYPEEAWIEGKTADEDGYLCGETGCGLCGLYDLRQSGITHLKLVGRGNSQDFMKRDIQNMRIALKILEESEDRDDYIKNMKKQLFPHGCSKNCYYK